MLDGAGCANECHVWVCGGEGTEADLIEEKLGPVEPKQFIYWTPGAVSPQPNFLPQAPLSQTTCTLSPSEIPSEWLTKFPSGEDIIRCTLEKRPPTGMNPDVRILKRRQCEYEIFLSVEQAYYLPRIISGFNSIDGFIGLAQTILQSRKSRSGNSLELHARSIMLEEGLLANVSFTHKPIIESGKRPDFIFPSTAAYEDKDYPAHRLRMLAAKTTCKDRWRQILNEADRIQIKHLLTLQEGVSEGQFREMTEAGVSLVVPAGIHKAYPESVRPHLITFESFLADVRLLSLR